MEKIVIAPQYRLRVKQGVDGDIRQGVYDLSR